MNPGAGLAAAALDWYAAHGRDLAFRRSTDPWAVLVSEVMAQQTQAARAAVAWSAFIDRYPTPAAFAATSPGEAIRAWRGLGYNRRAIALRDAAVGIVELHEGRVPDSLEALEALPGVGPYTARAVLAIAYGRPVAPLDTNIRRVLARYLGGLAGAAQEQQRLGDELVPAGSPGAWTHALMDIGATICRKRGPRCAACPLAASCALAGMVAAPATPAADIAGAGEAAAARPPSRRHGPAPRFETTTRWLRGRILDRLRDAPDGSWMAFETPIGLHDLPAVDAALASLAAERLVERDSARPSNARLAT